MTTKQAEIIRAVWLAWANATVTVTAQGERYEIDPIEFERINRLLMDLPQPANQESPR